MMTTIKTTDHTTKYCSYNRRYCITHDDWKMAWCMPCFRTVPSNLCSFERDSYTPAYLRKQMHWQNARWYRIHPVLILISSSNFTFLKVQSNCGGLLVVVNKMALNIFQVSEPLTMSYDRVPAKNLWVRTLWETAKSKCFSEFRWFLIHRFHWFVLILLMGVLWVAKASPFGGPMTSSACCTNVRPQSGTTRIFFWFTKIPKRYKHDTEMIGCFQVIIHFGWYLLIDLQKPSKTKGTTDLTRLNTLCDVASSFQISHDHENALYS